MQLLTQVKTSNYSISIPWDVATPQKQKPRARKWI